MRIILTILFCLFGFAYGQVGPVVKVFPGPYTPFNNYRFLNIKDSGTLWVMKQARFDDSVSVAGPAYINAPPVDGDSSARAVSSGWVKRNASSGGICINGLEDGTGLVTNTSGTTFAATLAKFKIACIAYESGPENELLDAAGDTGRIDLIVANTDGTIGHIKGVESIFLTPPTYDAITQVPLAFILVTDTGNIISGPGDTLWIPVGNSTSMPVGRSGLFIYGRGVASAGGGWDVSSSAPSYYGYTWANTGGGKKYGSRADNDATGGFWNISDNQQLIGFSAANKILMPTVTTQNSTANVMVVKDSITGWFGTRPIPGGGGTPGLQDVINTNHLLTGANLITGAGSTTTLDLDSLREINLRSRRIATGATNLISMRDAGIALQALNTVTSATHTIEVATGGVRVTSGDTTIFKITNPPIQPPETYLYGVRNSDGAAVKVAVADLPGGGSTDTALISSIAHDTTLANLRTISPGFPLQFQSYATDADSLVERYTPGAILAAGADSIPMESPLTVVGADVNNSGVFNTLGIFSTPPSGTNSVILSDKNSTFGDYANGTGIQISGSTASQTVQITSVAGTTISGDVFINPVSTASQIYADVYTPTITDVTNTSSSTGGPTYFQRIGNVVHIEGYFTTTTTLAAASQVSISVPIASTLGSTDDATGEGVSQSALATNISLRGNTAGEIRCNFTALSVSGSGIIRFSATYIIN